MTNRISGFILLIIDIFIWYTVRDIPSEIIDGRTLNQLPIWKLLLPIILLIVSLYLILKSKKDDK